ncbi:MAG: transposase [Thermoanaerobaculales bacterium]|nr:transposase [Thermoanaerobaculales bacterium]
MEILEVVQIDRLVNTSNFGLIGRPLKERRPIARAFVAKSVLGLTTTRSLLHALAGSPKLRKICGWSRLHDVPGESIFSRAFGEFADTNLCQRIHESLVQEVFEEHVVGHVCRDSTAIEAPERPPARRKGEKRKRKKPSKRISRQLSGMTVEEMVEELPKKSSWGCKINTRGHKYFWPGYKLHVDWSDCGIPISCLITSASLHDSQAAVPLANLTSLRVQSLYDLMDSAYDSRQIKEHSESLGHVPIIEMVRRGDFDTRPDHPVYRSERLKTRTLAEQGFGRLKESFGARTVRVRGSTRVMTHLMFGVLALTADRILALAN